MNNLVIKPILSEDRYGPNDLVTGELCVSKDTGLLLIKDSDELKPLIYPNGNILDLFNNTSLVCNIDDTIKYLELLGFKDLINSFIIDGRLVRFNLLVQYEFHHGQTKLIPGGVIPKSSIDELTSLLYDLSEDIDYTLDILPNKTINAFDEVTKYGDISDYISIGTLVNVSKNKELRIPEDKIDRLNSLVYHEDKEIEVGKKWNPQGDNDRFVYWFGYNEYLNVSYRLKMGDLIEMVILYKYTDNNRLPITWAKDPMQCNGIPSPMDTDPFIYYTNYTENFCKLNYVEYDEEGNIISSDPITLDGYHVTWGEISEYSRSIRFRLIPGTIFIADDFIIQISEDTVVVYTNSTYIKEYYIESCKVLSTEPLNLPEFIPEPEIVYYTVSVDPNPSNSTVKIYNIDSDGFETEIHSGKGGWVSEVVEHTRLRVIVECEGYVQYNQSFDVISDIKLRVELERIKIYGNFTIIPTPSDADIIINNQVTNTITNIVPFSVNYIVSKTGYKDEVGTVIIDESNLDVVKEVNLEVTKVNINFVTLLPLGSLLELNNLTSGKVIQVPISNDTKSYSGIYDYGTKLRSIFSKEGYFTDTREFNLIEDTDVTITLERISLSIDITSVIETATVNIYANDELLATGTGNASATAWYGDIIRIEVISDDHNDYSETFKLDSNITKLIDLEAEYTIKYVSIPNDALITISDSNNKVLVSDTGSVELVCISGTKIIVTIEKDGYFSYTESLTVSEDISKEITLEVENYVTFNGTPMKCVGIPTVDDTDPYIYYTEE